ncbi:MAG: DUF4956 domain-containing protein, partial [Clostridia bacterium]
MNSFLDVLKKSFLEGTGTQINIVGIIVVMLASLCVASLIYFIYRKCYCGVVYSHNFNISVAMMTIISAMIVATISSNVTLSLGMVGALSIVRFRTAIKDPVDLIFLFWAVSAGITIGARLWIMVLIGNTCVALAFFLLTKLHRKQNVFLLVLSFQSESFPEINESISKFKPTLRSKVTKSGTTEMTVELRLKDDNTQF